MPLYPEHFIQQVAQATDIIELVMAYMPIKQKGRDFAGLCPFHDDKNPSLSISATKQIFKCFSCGAGGGVFQWMMMYDKLSFPEAVAALAQRAGIPLPEASERRIATPQGQSKRDLAGVVEFASKFFSQQLLSPCGTDALAYARNRTLSDESIERFSLGYAPDEWDALRKAAQRESITIDQLVAAGLVVRKESGGCYDRFRNRLITPIMDISGATIGFGGRAMSSEDRAKYLNSPETVLFDKSRQLYGLNWARQHIMQSGRVVVVEGYFDVLIPHQAGVETVVATMGTALTDQNIRILARYANEIILVFDADIAGQAAATRALEMFLQQQINVRVVAIPDGKDPCDFVVANGGPAFTKLLDDAPDALTYVWQCQSKAIASSDSPAQRNKHIEEFLRLVAESESYGAIDGIRRGQLAQHIGHLLNIPAADLQQQLRRLARKTFRRSATAKPARVDEFMVAQGQLASEFHILEVLLNQPELFDHADERIDPQDFTDPNLRIIAQGVWAAGMKNRLSLDELLSSENLASEGALLTRLAQAGQKRGNYEPTLNGAIDKILLRHHNTHIQQLKSSGLDADETLMQLRASLNHPDNRKRPKIF